MKLANKPMAKPLSSRRLALELFLFFLFLYLLTANGRIVNRDGEAMFQVARSIAERGRFDIPAESAFETSAGPRGTEGDSLSFATETAKRGVDGNLYAMYGLGQSLASVPLYYAGKLLAVALPQVSPYFATRFAVALLNPAISALAAATLFALARTLGFTRRRSLLVALVYGLATMAWPYSKSYASEPLVGLMLVVACYCLVRCREGQAPAYAGSRVKGQGLGDGGATSDPRPLAPVYWPALAGAAFGFAVVVRVSTVVLLPLFAIYWLALLRNKTPTVGEGFTAERVGGAERGRVYSETSAVKAVFFLPICLSLAAIGWYNYARFGSPLVTGYGSIAWDRPLLEGLYGLLLSPGKGLLWYNPVLIVSALASVAFYRRRKREALFFAGLGLVWLAFHAPYRFWEGGWSWGPRLMLPVLPFLLLPAPAISYRPDFVGRLGSRLLPFAVALGLAVQVSAVAVDYTRYLWESYSTRPDDAYARLIHQPGSSPLVQQWPALAAAIGNALRAGELNGAAEAIAAKAGPRGGAGLSPEAISVGVLEETQVAGLNFPDFWFIYLYLFGAPGTAIVFAGLALLLGTGTILVVLDRRLRETDPSFPRKGESIRQRLRRRILEKGGSG